MKNIRTILLFFIALQFLVSCSLLKKQTLPDVYVEHLSDTARITGATVVYALPRTVFTIKVGMQRIIEIPGPYAKFADVLLGLQDVITAENEQWSVSKVTVSAHEEADPSEYYVADAGGILPSNVLRLKSEGLIMDLNPASYTRSISSLGNDMNINNFRAADLGSDEYFMTQTDTAYRRVRMDSQFIRVPYIVEKNKKLSVEEMAHRAARRLMDIRDGKVMILTGEANVFPQSSAAIDEINRLEKEYTELFTGRSIVEERSFSCSFIPLPEHAGKPVTLFKFSVSEGPAEEGIPVNITLTPELKTRDFTLLYRQQDPDTESPRKTLYYRIPDVVGLTLMMGEEKLYESRKLIYQFGEIVQLPGNYIIGN
jgi:hypothetical protein